MSTSHTFAPSGPEQMSAALSIRVAICATGLALLGLGQASQARAQDAGAGADVSTAELKSLSVDELLNLEVTSVAKHPEKLADAAAAIQVVTNEDIRDSGAVTIPESLRLADNLEVAQKNSHDWAISARGFNTDLANKLLVLIDGRSVYTPLYSGVFWSAQDYLLADLDRIEVVSGPGGTLWGANAVNGVINIITKSARDTQGLYLEGGGGDEWQDFASARYGGTLAPDVYYRVYAKYLDSSPDSLATGTNATDAWRQARGGFRIDGEGGADDLYTVQGDIYSSDEDRDSSTPSRLRGLNLLGRWNHTLSSDADTSLQAYFDQTHLSLPAPAIAFAPAGVVEDTLNTYDVDFQHRFALNSRHRIVWGLGYRLTQDSVDNALAISFFPASLNQNLFSGFAQDEISLADAVRLTVGTKLEHNDYTGFEVEPSIRMEWHVRTEELLWAAISRAVRTPSRIDHDLQEPASSTGLTVLAGGSDFESETLIAYELGYRGRIGPKLTASISTFYNVYGDIRSTAPSAHPTIPLLPFPLTFENGLEGKTQGAELGADYQAAEHWRLHAGYTFLHEQIRIKPGEIDFSNGYNETADPKQQASLRSSVALAHQISLDTTLRWVDTLHLNNGPALGLVPSYTDLDARLAWRASRHLELALVGQNLLHAHHPEYGFPGPARTEIDRSVLGRISWTD